MLTVSSKKLDGLGTLLKDKDFVVIGEMHGSSENATLMQHLLEMLCINNKTPVTIAFEWALAVDEIRMLNDYVHRSEVPNQLPVFFLDSDYRFNIEHTSLLKWVREYNRQHPKQSINIFTFESSAYEAGSDRELNMANALLTYKKSNLGPILVETGNIHARKQPYIYQTEEQIPMAAHLKQNSATCSIFIKYLEGRITIDGTQEDVTRFASQQEGPRDYFDAMIEIEVSHASRKILDLTEIKDLL